MELTQTDVELWPPISDP